MTLEQLLGLLANTGGAIVRTASLSSEEIAAARIEGRMAAREDGCGFVHIPERTAAPASVPEPAAPQGPTSEQNARWAIDGAILKGRMNIDPPPSPDHWLNEYWQIGRQLAEYGKTGIDNINPPDDAAPEVAQPAAQGKRAPGSFTKDQIETMRFMARCIASGCAMTERDGDFINSMADIAELATPAPTAGETSIPSFQAWRIDARVRPPEPGLIVKGWNSGAVWAGHFDGSTKMASCDWWMPIAAGEASAAQPLKLHPASEYHEDYSDVLWFAFPSFNEAPQVYCGSPLEVSPEFDDEHWTHFARVDWNDAIWQAEAMHISATQGAA